MMTERRGTAPVAPTLFNHVLRGRSRLLGLTIVLLLVLSGAGLWLTLQVRTAKAETLSIEARGAIVAQQAEAADDVARGATAPTLSATLDALEAHLPATLALAAAEGRPGGVVRIAIDTPDPDALRQDTAGDSWLERFRERAQEQHDDGSFRVVLERR